MVLINIWCIWATYTEYVAQIPSNSSFGFPWITSPIGLEKKTRNNKRDKCACRRTSKWKILIKNPVSFQKCSPSTHTIFYKFLWIYWPRQHNSNLVAFTDRHRTLSLCFLLFCSALHTIRTYSSHWMAATRDLFYVYNQTKPNDKRSVRGQKKMRWFIYMKCAEFFPFFNGIFVTK